MGGDDLEDGTTLMEDGRCKPATLGNVYCGSIDCLTRMGLSVAVKVLSLSGHIERGM